MLLCLVIFASLRYEVGWDYISYVQYTTGAKDPSDYSFIWQALFDFANKIDMPHLSIALPNCLTYFILYYALKNLLAKDKDICDALFVYATWPFFYLSSFSTIRQSLACSIFFLLYVVLLERKYFISLLLWVLCVLLHPSSVIGILLFPLILYRKNLKKWHLLIFSILSVIALAGIHFIVTSLGLNSYLIYLSGEEQNGKTLIILYTMVLVYILCFRFKHEKIDLVISKQIDIVIMSLIVCVSILFMGLSMVIMRAMDYFTIFLILIFYRVVTYQRNKTFNRHCLSILLVALFFTYLMILGNDSHGASSGYLPYNTILAK